MVDGYDGGESHDGGEVISVDSAEELSAFESPDKTNEGGNAEVDSGDNVVSLSNEEFGEEYSAFSRDNNKEIYSIIEAPEKSDLNETEYHSVEEGDETTAFEGRNSEGKENNERFVESEENGEGEEISAFIEKNDSKNVDHKEVSGNKTDEYNNIEVHNSENRTKQETDYSRPTHWRAGMKDEVWENAKDEHGRVRDPVTGKYISKDQAWDMGHKPGYEFYKHQESARERGISRQEFLDEYYNSDHYRPELPSSNRSHKGENVTDDYFGD